MSNVAINIAAEFTGKKAFKQAETATQKLTGNVKKLAGAVGIAFGANAILAYSKASVKAFAQDEAAALRLNRAVENLGIGFANPQIADYIANLEKSAAIADDVLRPAFQGLLTTTGSLAQSQKLLNDAITISRASGVDLATVTEDLGKGYVGITRGLAKYNTGLTRAELNTKTFSEILGIVLNRSAGAAEDYLTTTSYKMEVLGIATGNASEIIGEGFIDALARVGGGTEASDAAKAIEGLAKAFNFVTLGAGTALGGITSVLRNLKNLPKDIFLGFAGKQAGVNFVAPKKVDPVVTLSEKKQQQALAALEIAAIKRQKELNALKNKQLATQKKLSADKKKQDTLDKAALLLAQGQKVFDEEGIQLAAAAQGKLTEEERVRVALKKDIYELEAAISEENISAAARLSASMVSNAQKLSALRGDMVGLNNINNPFDAWLATLIQMSSELAKINDAMLEAQRKTIRGMLDSIAPQVNQLQQIIGRNTPIEQQREIIQEQLNRAMPDIRALQDRLAQSGVAGYSQASMNSASITVNVAGSISTERDIVSAITQGLYAQQAAGTPVNYSTVY
jgi:hypothetical protein